MAPFYDACIVGAGPAGCAAALHLVRRGCGVMAAEAGDYYMARPGEVLDASCAAALAALGVPVNWRELASVVSLWGYEKAVETPGLFHPSGGGRVVCRGELEARMAQAALDAGVQVRLGWRLVGATRARDAWYLDFATPGGTQHARAGYVIDAGGRRLPFGRRQGAVIERSGDLVGLACWTSPQPRAASALQSMHIEAVRGGWWYAVARPDDSLAAVFFTRAATLRRKPGGPAAAWQTALERSLLVAPLLPEAARRPARLHVYPASPALARSPGGPSWLAAGDAAICFDPLKGDGVRHALETGMRAAEAALLPPGERDAILPYYASVLRDRFDEHLRTRREVYEQAAERLGDEFLQA